MSVSLSLPFALRPPQLEEEQLMKESKIRESGHQFAVPGEKIKHSSVAKGMAASYMQKL